MSYISENVIPGNYGKIFGTDANKREDLIRIKQYLLQIDGIKEVIFNDIFPKEFTVHTSKVVHVSEIEKKVRALGFHAVPKKYFPL